jgi:hypothetical protein
MELDEHHLKQENDRSRDERRNRVCFVPAKLDSYNNIVDTFEEAIDLIDRVGNDYTEYTIIPRIYKTDY